MALVRAGYRLHEDEVATGGERISCTSSWALDSLRPLAGQPTVPRVADPDGWGCQLGVNDFVTPAPLPDAAAAAVSSTTPTVGKIAC